MARLVLKGTTLGERHKHYNEILKEVLEKTQSSDTVAINNDDRDIQNLLKIDIANSKKNVDYILDVLKSEDMLYVSRAIKRCTWLITEPQYAHIINPHHLYTQLFPYMTTKATNKFILLIRLNLKHEIRVEDFYNHFRNINKTDALKWLPNCSLGFIENEVDGHKGDIDFAVLGRLCERSFTILEMHLSKFDNKYVKGTVLLGMKFLIHTHTEKMFDFLATLENYQLPNFGPKITNSIMKKCPQKILNNFATYCQRIDLKTFAKHLKKECIQDFLLKHVEKESMKYWFKFDNLKHFIRRMPKGSRFEFLKAAFIEKSYVLPKNSDDGGAQLFCAKKITSTSNSYLWYQFASFDVACPDLMELIRFESSPVKKNAMLRVLVSCAGHSLQDIHTLLHYYHDKHINEPFRFKNQFVNYVLSQADTHLFDEKNWSILNNIFSSMEVYTESENNVQLCIQSIIVYKVLHGETVPENVEKKFIFDTLKPQEKKLDKEEKEKVFTYLYNIISTKIQNKDVQNEVIFAEVLQFLESALNLLIDWKRELIDYPLVIDEIKKLVQIKVRNSWTVDLSSLYNKKKSWRKHLFEDSLTLYPKESACVNALKHDSDLIQRRRSEVEALCCNDRVSLDQLLSKMRIYWPESLAREWTDWYLSSLDRPGRQALVRGLCVLLPQKQLVDIVRKYAPTESKIIWSEENDIELSLRKQFAKNMYIARPLPSLEIVLLYAQGDYLQFALPSLNAIMYNLSPDHSRQYIAKLLDAPVSLKKHGIRLACRKLESMELIQMFFNIFKSAKNSTIRAGLFKETHDLLCRETNLLMIMEIWKLFSMFIDSLSSNEDKIIFAVLNKVNEVPLAVRGEFCMKGYKYLKSLPAKANCENIITDIDIQIIRVVEFLDPDFVANILLQNLHKNITTKRIHGYTYILMLSSYLLCANDTNSQSQRYEKVLVPFLESCFDQWTLKTVHNYFARDALNNIITQLCMDIQIFSMEKKLIIPVKLFADILNKLEANLSIINNYILLRTWKLTVTYVKLLEWQKEKISSIFGDATCSEAPVYYYRHALNRWNDVYLAVAPEFAKNCTQYLKDDINAYFPSVYLMFAEALKNMFFNMGLSQIVYLDSIKLMLGDTVESYLVVLVALPEPYFNNDEEKAKYSDILKIIRSHSSHEVKTHYFKRYENYEAGMDT